VSGTDLHRQETIGRVIRVQEAMREDALTQAGARLSGAEATTLAQARVLFQLRAASPLSVSELASGLNVTPPAVSPVVDQLVRRQLLSRREFAEDRRITLVELTDSGRAFIEGALLVRNQRMVEVLQRLADEELETVAAAFDILSRVTDELRREKTASDAIVG
jgi:DNA-binding MarR family transcriptional regulator